MEGRAEEEQGGVEQSGVPTEEGIGRDEPQDGSADIGTEKRNEEEDPLKYEDAIQTAKRILGKDKDKETETEESAEEAPVQDGQGETTDKSGAKDKGSVDPDDIEPPVRLTAEAKQAFKKWPKRAKTEFSTAIKQMESRFTQSQQQASEAYKESKHLLDAVRPYYVSKPELAAKGITESQVVSGLIGNHQLLTHDDPAVRREKFLAIGRSIGVVDESGRRR